MSIELIESFIQFARGKYAQMVNCTNSTLTAVPGILSKGANAWDMYMLNSYGAYPCPVRTDIIADPVFPARNRLQVAHGFIYEDVAWTAFMLKRSVPYTGIRRIGFLLQMLTGTASYVSVDPGTAAIMGGAHPVATNVPAVVQFYRSAGSSTLNISHSASGTATAISYSLSTGKDYYVEIELDTSAGTYRVWVDDYLIIDASMSAAAKTAYTAAWALRFARRSEASNNPIPMAYVSDIYVLKGDGVAPSARLGKTTRVKGELPNADVSVSFDRPTGYTSNVDVVANGMASTNVPTSYLTGSGVGATDIYAVPLDAYAAQVYAVKVSAIAANFSSAAHRVDAVLKDGNGNSIAQPMATLAAGAAFTPMQSIFTVAPDGSAFTPQNVATANFGYTIAT